MSILTLDLYVKTLIVSVMLIKQHFPEDALYRYSVEKHTSISKECAVYAATLDALSWALFTLALEDGTEYLTCSIRLKSAVKVILNSNKYYVCRYRKTAAFLSQALN